MRLAILGMGQMGRALASRLLDTGHDLTVWNRSPERASALIERGATEAGSPVEAAAGADVVMILLTDDAAVSSVLLPGGAPLPLSPRTLVVDCSTVAPTTSRTLAEAFAGRFAASPVFGGPGALEAGQAMLAVAGPTAVLDALDPLLADVSGNVRRCGEDPGIALVAKLVNNYLLMAGVAILAEAVVAAQRTGLDNDFVAEMLSASAMVAPGLRNRVRDLVDGDHDGWFPPPMGAKDVALFLAIAATPEHRLPLAEMVKSRYTDAVDAGLADKDLTSVIELLRR